eukprot:9479132-Pyramimonas_sp.AAC.2
MASRQGTAKQSRPPSTLDRLTATGSKTPLHMGMASRGGLKVGSCSAWHHWRCHYSKGIPRPATDDFRSPVALLPRQYWVPPLV